MATIYNQAQLVYNNAVINSNTVSAELVETLAVTKTPVGDTYGPGDRVTYVVELVNSGTVPFTGLTVTDNLGEYSPAAIAPAVAVPLTYVAGSARYFVEGIPQGEPNVTGTSPLTVTGLNVPAGGNAALVYEADVNDFAPLGIGSTVNNTATVTGDGLTAPVTADAQVTAAEAPELAVTKAVTPATVAENGTLTYTFTIENRGNTPASDTVVLSDNFDPVLSNVTVTYNGAPWTETTDYTYGTANGAFATVPGAITVPAATYAEDPATGATVTTPGVATVTVTGNV